LHRSYIWTMVDGLIEAFVDEAGDLGFGIRSTRYFVVAYVIPSQPDRARANIVHLIRALRLHNRTSIKEFKHSRDSPRVRSKLLETIVALDVKAGVVVVNKESVDPELRYKPVILYNYLCARYIVSGLLSLHPRKVIVRMDRRMSAEGIQSFNQYFASKLSWKSMEADLPEPEVEVHHVDSAREKCVQIADYVAGACFMKFEHSDPLEYDMLKSKILFNTGWGVQNW
jgi:hypothetical protein